MVVCVAEQRTAATSAQKFSRTVRREGLPSDIIFRCTFLPQTCTYYSVPTMLAVFLQATAASSEAHVSCGGNYGWMRTEPSWGHTPCPPPTWDIAWELNRSTTPFTPWGPESAEGDTPGFTDPVNASRWGWINFDWSDANGLWQDTHPHDNEAVLVKQCSMVKARGTGTRCMVYRNNELALQWQETSRAVMTEEYTEKGWFLRFKNQTSCDSAAPCSIAAWHNIQNQSAPLVPCNKEAPVAAPNCAYCCNFTGRAYNEPIGGAWPPAPNSHRTRFGDNALNDGGCTPPFKQPPITITQCSLIRIMGRTRAVPLATLI